ncbi:MAG: GNAT family N-acetyltransferase [Paracoccaceae bacterium]|nr:GNAT family N-acetyltransferase [Paracoccaceae bacterium]
MSSDRYRFQVRMANTPSEVIAAQRLRYRVFVEELGGDGRLVDHENRLERDEFDEFARHLILIDTEVDDDDPDRVVGAYRLMTSDDAKRAGRFYSASEYDLQPLISSGRKLLELGRSCLLPEQRGGTAMHRMWATLAEFVLSEGCEILFGVASFHGTDAEKLAEPLSALYHKHLAPEDIRVRALPPHRIEMNRIPADQIDAIRAMKATPALIKAYLRLGGFVGDGAYVDHEFNTIDVCLMVDTTRMNARRKAMYTGN